MVIIGGAFGREECSPEDYLIGWMVWWAHVVRIQYSQDARERFLGRNHNASSSFLEELLTFLY